MNNLNNNAFIMLLLVLPLYGCNAIQGVLTDAKTILLNNDAARLPNVLRTGPPISTNLRDATYMEACLDGLKPHDREFAVLFPKNMNADGAFILTPGFYRLEADAYIIEAQMPAAIKQSAFVYAPLRGPRAELVQSLLHNITHNQELTFNECQSIVFAVAAGMRYSDMSPELQNVAAKVLSGMQRFELNGGLFGVASTPFVNKLLGGIPDDLREFAREEEKVRRQLQESYYAASDVLESIAVFAGANGNNSSNSYIPSYRWSRHPDGYFVRYTILEEGRLRFDIFVSSMLNVDAQGKLIDIGPVFQSNDKVENFTPRLVEFYPRRHVAVPANSAFSMLVSAGVSHQD